MGDVQAAVAKEPTTEFKSAESVLERSQGAIDRFVEVDQCSVNDEERAPGRPFRTTVKPPVVTLKRHSSPSFTLLNVAMAMDVPPVVGDSPNP